MVTGSCGGPSLRAMRKPTNNRLRSPEHPAPTRCGAGGCDCAGVGRREFLKSAGLAVAGLALSKLPVAAGPFTKEDFEKLVPADKKLDPAWVKSLVERGARTVYRWPESQWIGMPVGGICTGQLYLGGDGKLWHWDIFNRGEGTGDGHYAHPPKPASPLDQGFALMVTAGGQSQMRALDHTGWREVTFRGEYPIGLVDYRDPEWPFRSQVRRRGDIRCLREEARLERPDRFGYELEWFL